MLYGLLSDSVQHRRDRRSIELKLANQLSSVLEHRYPDIVFLLPAGIAVDVMNVQFGAVTQ